MADGYIIYGDGSTANHGIPNSFTLERPIPPIHYKGATYVVAYSDPPVRPGIYLAVFKTANAVEPFTFAEMDLANEIETTRGAAYYPQTGGNLIYLGLTVSGGNRKVNILTFDMDTDTYGPVISSTGPTLSIGAGFFSLAHRANGNWLVGLNAAGGTQIQDVWWSEYSGAWSANAKVSTLVVAANDSANLEDMTINDATGDAAFYWNQTYHADGYATKYRYLTVISNAGAHGTNINWNSSTTTDGEQGSAVYNSFQDQWEYPFTDRDNSNPSTIVLGLIESTPSANPTSNTKTQNMDGGIGAFPRVAIDNTTGILYFGWATGVDPAGPPFQFQYATRQADGSTTWGGTTTLYDNTVDTLTPVPSGISGTTVVDLPFFGVDAGTIRMVCNPLCDFQYYFQAALTLACPINNTGAVEAPYSAFLIADFGVGPYTFAIIGGMLPVGFALNPVTGEIHGRTKVGGTYSYTAQVTDSNGATATISCAIIIPVVTIGDAGRKLQPLTPNQFDLCLHREYRLFCNTDRERLGCAKLPHCFTVDEREWGDPV